MNIGITTYNLQIKKSGKSEYFSLDSIQFEDLIKKFVTNLEAYYKKDNTKKMFSIDKYDFVDIKDNTSNSIFKNIVVKMDAGSFGAAGSIVNSKTGEKKYDKTTEEALMNPYYFSIAIPNGEITKALLLIENVGASSVKMVVERELKSFLKKENKNFILEVKNLLPKMMAENYMKNGILKKVKIIQNSVSNDFADKLGVNRGVKEMALEYTIKNPVGFMQKREKDLKEFMHGKKSLSQVIEIKDIEYDDLKLEFSVNSKTRTVSLANLDKICASVDITKDIVYKDGNPTFDSMKNVLNEISNDYLNDMGLILE